MPAINQAIWWNTLFALITGISYGQFHNGQLNSYYVTSLVCGKLYNINYTRFDPFPLFPPPWLTPLPFPTDFGGQEWGSGKGVAPNATGIGFDSHSHSNSDFPPPPHVMPCGGVKHRPCLAGTIWMGDPLHLRLRSPALGKKGEEGLFAFFPLPFVLYLFSPHPSLLEKQYWGPGFGSKESPSYSPTS